MKKSVIKTISVILILVMIMCIVTACNSTKSTGSEETEITGNEEADNTASEETETKELEKVTFGTTAWPTNMFAFLAEEKGIFEENGLDVDIEYFPSSSDSSNAFITGNLDLCTYASPDTIPPFSRGADFDVIIMTDKSLGSDGLVAASGINSIADLKGKNIGTQLYSVDHMYLLTLLDQAGMSADDVNIIDMTIADAGTAFIAGQLDAASIWEPYLSRAVEGGGRLLYSTKEDPDLITDSIAASSEMTGNRAEITQAFVNSLFEAVKYWQDNQEEAEKIMAEKLEVTTEEFRAMMETIYVTNAQDSVDAFTPAENEAYYGFTQQKIAKFLTELKVIDNEPKVDDMINDTFVKQYLKLQ